jgi:hypothetical protein
MASKGFATKAIPIKEVTAIALKIIPATSIVLLMPDDVFSSFGASAATPYEAGEGEGP